MQDFVFNTSKSVSISGSQPQAYVEVRNILTRINFLKILEVRD